MPLLKPRSNRRFISGMASDEEVGERRGGGKTLSSKRTGRTRREEKEKKSEETRGFVTRKREC